MEKSYFSVKIDSKVARIKFNREHKANALNMAAWQEMKRQFETLGKNTDVRVILLEGAGKHWCAGIDLELLMNFSQFDKSRGEAVARQELRAFILELQSCIGAIAASPQPVIAVIQGACVGAGLDIASACDMRFCTDDAFFSIKEIEWAMVADLGSLQRLTYILSPGILNEMAYTGRDLGGTEAEKIQLVNQCFAERQEMENYVLEMAKKIASMAPLAIRGTKEVLHYSRNHSIEDSLLHVANYNAAFLSQENMTEAFTARVEKREARYP